jgi:dTMP kinase
MTTPLIIFEGPDAVGKSTLVKHLESVLRERSIPAEILAFPGNRPGTLGKLVYDIHHAPSSFGIQHILPISIQALHIAAHLDAINQTILPALRAGTWVVLDRFWWSAWVYGIAAGAESPSLASLIDAERIAWGNSKPAVLFLVRRDTPLRPEEDPALFVRLTSLYEQLKTSEQRAYPIVELTNTDLTAAQELITRWVAERVDAE